MQNFGFSQLCGKRPKVIKKKCNGVVTLIIFTKVMSYFRTTHVVFRSICFPQKKLVTLWKIMMN